MTGQRFGLDDLSGGERDRLRLRLEHLLEVETGFRSGSRYWARPDEPRAAYDPTTTTLTERRRAKAVELGALSTEEVRQLGWSGVGERTLDRMAAAYRELGPAGLIDGRRVGAPRGRRSVGPEVEEAIRAVHEQCLRRSRISMASRERLIHQYVREVFPDREVRVPHRTTLARVWRERVGPGGARQRYVRSAAAVPAPTGAAGGRRAGEARVGGSGAVVDGRVAGQSRQGPDVGRAGRWLRAHRISGRSGRHAD
ncbi:hypothetical protein [Streptomyces subrutilus]|uniref:Uncharacterized protein n=1 Tax=Streptomyces subrutilus TaxID=36818 RepID=A0A1E5Q061_9ACTN|nr:hypothetical protein [Streptomyces subrutilus]OEJ35288.1 hypothetical protein BGK67_31900 [Streptomyces subrutilus]